jgi:uroporphyrinogen-III synthase
MVSRIFISKNANDCEPLVHYCNQNSIELIAESLIEFEGIPFKNTSSYDVVFFSSVRSGQFYLANPSKNPNLVYACIGETTKNKLYKLGIDCEFVGKEAGNPKKVAQEFKIWLKNKIVFFPQSNLSLGTFSSILPKNQVIKEVVYKTNLKSKEINKCQIYIFTSPSNLDAFLIINQIPKDSKVIVWGKSTSQHAVNRQQKIDYVLENSEMKELLDLLSQLT